MTHRPFRPPRFTDRFDRQTERKLTKTYQSTPVADHVRRESRCSARVSMFGAGLDVRRGSRCSARVSRPRRKSRPKVSSFSAPSLSSVSIVFSFQSEWTVDTECAEDTVYGRHGRESGLKTQKDPIVSFQNRDIRCGQNLATLVRSPCAVESHDPSRRESEYDPVAQW